MVILRGVSKYYPSGDGIIQALKGIDFRVNKGEFVAVIGHSGSGKSTLMNLMGCLDRPTTGEYLLNGRPVDNMNGKALSEIRKNCIGFVFQSFNLMPGLTALENVELPLVYAGWDKKERRRAAIAALEEVNLGDRMYHLPSQMSGGQQQRTAIARAIILRPPLILADEPTGNLDSTAGELILTILEQLNRQGHTIVLITHADNVAARAGRVIELFDGRIRECS